MKDQPQQIQSIPVNQIRVVNPRARNKLMFQSIVGNIGNVGLKKPITVARRQPDKDGTRYDLVVGQGRLEALIALGETTIPAIIIDAPAEERHLMSLVENIARRRPSNSELIREVRSLMERGHNSPAIADKLGLDKTYINQIVRLLRKGEHRLIEKVEAGTLPVLVAAKIASASDKDVQKALNEAYESGELRGAKFRAVQALIAQRFAKSTSVPAKPMSRKDVVREYEKQTQHHRALVRRANIVAQRLALLTSALKQLLRDDHFVTLLRAESLDKVPAPLVPRTS